MDIFERTLIWPLVWTLLWPASMRGRLVGYGKFGRPYWSSVLADHTLQSLYLISVVVFVGMLMTYDLGQQLVGWLDKFKPASLPPVQPWSRAWRGGLGRRCGDTLKGKHGTKMNQLFYQVPARMYWQFTSGCETRRWARELVIYLEQHAFSQ